MATWNERSAEKAVRGLKHRCDARASVKAAETEEHADLVRKAAQYDEYLAETASRRAKSGTAAGLPLLFLAILLCGMVLDVEARIYTGIFFVGLVLAGACGAMLRMIWHDAPETPVLSTVILGGIAGVIVGLAYAIPQWVGAPGFLEFGASITPAVKIQFASALIVALSAGVGFDIVFERFKNAAVERVEKAFRGDT